MTETIICKFCAPFNPNFEKWQSSDVKVQMNMKDIHIDPHWLYITCTLTSKYLVAAS